MLNALAPNGFQLVMAPSPRRNPRGGGADLDSGRQAATIDGGRGHEISGEGHGPVRPELDVARARPRGRLRRVRGARRVASRHGGGSAHAAAHGRRPLRYALVGRFDLPEPTRTTPPTDSLLAQEASSVTYDWDTDTLFVVGDGGTSVVQVVKTGQLIDSMTLAAGQQPAGHDVLRHRGHHLRRRRHSSC